MLSLNPRLSFSSLLNMAAQIQWSNIPEFEFWLVKYFAIALDTDSPIVEAMAFGRPVKKFMTRTNRNTFHIRYKIRYVLPGYNLGHCFWGPSCSSPNGTFWNKYGMLDRIDGPAIECKAPITIGYPLYGDGYLFAQTGSKFWFRAGELHRIGGPAIEHPNGVQEWWNEGILQRKRYDSGTERYFLPHAACPGSYFSSFTIRHGNRSYILHRDDGPAEVSSTVVHLYQGLSTKKVDKWYHHGILHRLDGPAIVSHNPESEEWWIDGVRYTRESHRLWVQGLLDNQSSKRQKIEIILDKT